MADDKKAPVPSAKEVSILVIKTSQASNTSQSAQAALPAAAASTASASQTYTNTKTKSPTKIIWKIKTKHSAANTVKASYPAISASAGKARIYKNPRNLPRGAAGTHRPIGPRGSVVLVKDNKNLDRSKAVTNKVEQSKTTIRFKDVNGNYHEHAFPGRSQNKWTDAAWIAGLNKWRYQTLSRKFKYDPSVVRGHRGKWTMAEKTFLRATIKAKIEESGDRLVGKDWEAIAKAHNEKFAGKVVKKGEELLKGGVAAKDYELTERSAVAIRAQFDKSEDLKQEMEELVAEYTDDEDEEQGEEMEGVLNDHGGDLDHHLEDPSDDEDDGRRPASNPTGAILVAAC